MMELLSHYAVPAMLLLVPLYGLLKGKPVYELFVSGAAEGVGLMLSILPYLLAMLTVIAVFRASGAFAALAGILEPLTSALGIPPEVLPVALLRPLSGNGALALTADVINTCGPDSSAGLLASVMQGSTDTTCYILAVYFGAVGVKKYRYALTVGLAADLVSFLAAAVFSAIFFNI